MVYADDVLGVSDGWPAAIMLLLCAPAVFGFIYCGMRYSLLNINDYNKAAETDRKEHAGEQDFYAKLTGAVCGIIMLIATATGLCLLFLNPAALRGDCRPSVERRGRGDVAGCRGRLAVCCAALRPSSFSWSRIIASVSDQVAMVHRY